MRWLLIVALCLLAAPAISLFTGVSTVSAQTITMGDAVVETWADDGNGNLVVAQQATLIGAGTLNSLSFYVTTAAGQEYLAVYSDNAGQPGSLLAQTAAFMPAVGWNTKPTLATPVLTPGSYWLIYAPSSNTLAFRKQNTSGACFYVNRTFQALPATWPTTGVNSCTPTTWSFYATLTTAPPAAIVYSGPYTETNALGGTAACTMVNANTLSCALTPPLQYPGQ